MRIFRKFFAFLLSLLMIFPFAATASAADSKTIRILFTHDLHSSLSPEKVPDPNGGFTESGGFARLYSAIKARSAGAGGTLLVDAGDYSMGTLFQTLETTESPELRLMGEMGYDAVTAGNHEFDYTCKGFAKSLEAAAAGGGRLPAYVISNMTLADDGGTAQITKAMNDYGIKDYIVIDKGGIRIGIYGVMGEEAAADAATSYPASFGDIIEASKRVVKILKEQENADLVVCLSHSGTDNDASKSEDEKLAKAVPDIDVIISGHTHTVLTRPVTVGHTLIVSCGANGAYLGSVDLSFDGAWKAQGYSLIPIDSSLPSDPGVQSKIDAYKAHVNSYLSAYGYSCDQVIADSPYQFEDIEYMYGNPNDYALGNLLSDAMISAIKNAEGDAYVPVDAAVVPMGIIRATINKGKITVSDAFKILSLGTGPDGLSGYPLITVYLTGEELKNVCEVDASVSAILEDAQLFIAGVKYSYNTNRLIFNKVTGCEMLKADGSTEKIYDKKLYRVACGLYSGQMLAYVKKKSFGILSITPKDKYANEITDFSEQIIYANNAGKLSEVKEWQAVVQYLMSFPKQGGISVIPSVYEKPQGRKTVSHSAAIGELVSNLNMVTLAALAAVLFILALLIFIVTMIATRKKRRERRTAKREAKLNAASGG